jgi:hypothetical protein
VSAERKNRRVNQIETTEVIAAAIGKGIEGLDPRAEVDLRPETGVRLRDAGKRRPELKAENQQTAV